MNSIKSRLVATTIVICAICVSFANNKAVSVGPRLTTEEDDSKFQSSEDGDSIPLKQTGSNSTAEITPSREGDTGDSKFPPDGASVRPLVVGKIEASPRGREFYPRSSTPDEGNEGMESLTPEVSSANHSSRFLDFLHRDDDEDRERASYTNRFAHDVLSLCKADMGLQNGTT